MSLSDDDVVSKAACGECGPTYFRDLDKHIQDRLRAAEELAKVVNNSTSAPNDTKMNGYLWYDLRQALATYRATFPKEASK